LEGGNKLDKALMLSSSPHIKGKDTTQRIMIDVIIALLPAVITGVYFFGIRVLAVVFVTVASCVISEYTMQKITGKKITTKDFSAVVTGTLLAINLPPAIPLWIALIGGVIAIIVIKQMFGGIGQNFINPALGARIILLLSWTQQMTNWVNPKTPDIISSATPLDFIKKGGELLSLSKPTYTDLFLGNIMGSIGETSVLALLIGAAYLFYRKVISPIIPFSFILTVALFTWIFGGAGDPIYHILTGGIILGAFFMATDYATSPVTTKGKIIMGVGCGIVTSIIRLYANYPEGVSFAIVLMNILVPLIDKYTIPKPFGGERKIA
jgi:electron transport complex protein RnfD